MITYTPEEVEEQRIDSIKELELDDAHFKEISEPKSFGYHEAFHTSSILMDSVERHLMDHPAVLGDPEAYKLAHAAFVSLFNLYQHLGTKHL